MNSLTRNRWLVPLRDLLPVGLGGDDEIHSGERQYFCRTCGTTLESHTSCPDCGSHMVEATASDSVRRV